MTETNQTAQEPAQAPVQVSTPVEPQSKQKPVTVPMEVLTLIEARIANEKKSTMLAYFLWFFLGWFGVHHFYLGKPIVGVIYLLLSIIGGATWAIGVGAFCLAIVGIGLIIDLFRIPGFIQKNIAKKRMELIELYRQNGTI